MGAVVAGAGVRFHREVWFKRRGAARGVEVEWSAEEREACGGVSGDQWCVAVPLMCSESCEGLQHVLRYEPVCACAYGGESQLAYGSVTTVICTCGRDMNSSY